MEENHARNKVKTWKNLPKNHISGLEEGVIGLKSLNPQKAYLWPIPIVHTKFQRLNPILWENRGGAAFFQGQKREKPLTPSLLIDLGFWFLDMLYNFWFCIDWLEKEQFFSNLAHFSATEFLLEDIPPAKISSVLSIDAHSLNDQFWSVSNWKNNFSISGKK